LRAVLLVGVEGQPEGLTEGLLALVRAYAPRLPPADVVRLLTILGESEERVRRSGNARLAVEVLLLRWAMADRTVELSEVLDALKGVGRSDSRTVGQPPQRLTPPVMRDVVPPAPDRQTVRPSDGPTPPVKGELSLAHLAAVWSSIVADARTRAPMLGSLLAEAQVAGLDGRVVTLRPAHPAHAEGLERQRELIGQLMGRYVTEAPRVKVAAAVAERPVRLTEEGANAERLKVLRAKDPTLSAAVDALDLELLE
jgi:DNA polymerase-3 subunit gamma/tau